MGMIDKENITHLAEEGLASSDCFLVDVNIHPGNLIVVEIDHNQAVGIDDCVVLSQYIEQRLDRDMEDYELEVGSSGIGTPFKIVRQYIKNCSNEVEVLLKNGLKLKGILKSANESGITLTVAVKTKPEGSKRKITVLEEQTFLYDEIKYTKNIIRFK
jgi:ribosome maturation factor RimP